MSKLIPGSGGTLSQDAAAAVQLIKELATTPPVKDMANVKAATDVFEANVDAVRQDPSKAHPRHPRREA